MTDEDAEILEVCREARLLGERQSHAIMSHFNVDYKRADVLITRAKRRHPDHGIPNDPRGPSKGTTRRYDDRLLAAAAWDAFRAGTRLAYALSQQFGMSERYATNLLARLRKEGASIPYCPTAPHGPHLAARGCPCDECRAGLPVPVQVVEERPERKVTVIGAVQLPESALPMGPWVADAACKGTPTNLFYPERGEPTRQALEVCKPCPVKIECLQYSIDNSERWGVWGGMTERQRRRIRSDRYQARRNAK